MNEFDFNSPIDRYAQRALKYHYYPKDVLPLWIADSDYAVSPAIQRALTRHANQGVYGYQLAEHVTELNESVVRWLARQHNWQIDPEWLVWVPGIMVGVNSCARALTKTGDVIHCQIPNYPPLHTVAKNNERHSRSFKTQGSPGAWQLDWHDLEVQMQGNAGGMMILTNP
ncbi:MAG: aminotransferase class I/II-fold pyridoxal phosphate-dependent enzyme, partial [Enterobacterales bacterium]|nr:aminotransferase class I/II-fold pyridoxal phosphate-dependent enzyme [Enterobacterales bacterium]